MLSKLVLGKYYNYFIRKLYLRLFIKKNENSLMTKNYKLKPNLLFNFNNVINSMSDEIVKTLL